eukprot:COSAG02_NODE_408_length_22892_cov_35.212785_21_plen_53_part_00
MQNHGHCDGRSGEDDLICDLVAGIISTPCGKLFAVLAAGWLDQGCVNTAGNE